MTRAAPTLAAAAAVALLAGAGVASAQGLGTSPFTMKLFGGWTMPQDVDFTIEPKVGASVPSGIDYSAGYVIGVSAGYTLTPNLAAEIEYAYRNADGDLTNDLANITGQVASNAYMANLVYTFPPAGSTPALRPYVGGGLGMADMQYKPNGVPRLESDFTFAYQIFAGIGYQVNESWTLSGELRYFGINEQDLDSPSATIRSGFDSFDALFGASYRF